MIRRLPGSARVALFFVVFLWLVAAASPAFAARAADIRLEERLLPPSLAHPFGTDDLGRDLAARVIAATPISLTIGLVAAAVSVVVGFGIGAAGG
jgi:peptide/nickel transport system permease protein